MSQDNKKVEKKVQVLNAIYSSKYDLVQWLVQDIKTGDQRILVWNSETLRKSLNFPNKLQTEAVEKFCEMMIGKIFKWVSTPLITEFDPDVFREGSLARIYKEHDDLNSFPFWEILTMMKEDPDEIETLWS